jgi:hypothetical protein
MRKTNFEANKWQRNVFTKKESPWVEAFAAVGLVVFILLLAFLSIIINMISSGSVKIPYLSKKNS